jgi:hypothetical protein
MACDPPKGDPPSLDLYRKPSRLIFVVSSLLIFVLSPLMASGKNLAHGNEGQYESRGEGGVSCRGLEVLKPEVLAYGIVTSLGVSPSHISLS